MSHVPVGLELQPMSKMHRCLLVQDIVFMVLKNLLDNGPVNKQLGFSNQGSIKNFALTCRALSEPALNVLWSTIHSPIHLIRLMPSQLWCVGEKQYEEKIVDVYEFNKEPIQNDWNRLLHYNRRIRALEINRTSFGVLHPEAFRILTNQCPGELLPNICRITLGLGVAYIPEAIPLCSPCFLRHITHITVPDASSFPKKPSSAFESITKHCPQVQYLNIRAPYAVEESSNINWDLLSTMVQRMTQLKRIALCGEASLALRALPGQGPTSTFEHLSHFESLRGLTIDCTFIPESALKDIFSTQTGGFPNLTQLHLDTSIYKHAIMFLHGTLSNHPLQNGLRDLYVSVNNANHPAYLPGFSEFMAIFSEFQPVLETLINLTLYLPIYYFRNRSQLDTQVDLDSDSWEAVRASFSHLWPCTRLKQLEITSDLCGGLDDAWLMKAASSWPHLDGLLLDGSNCSSQATLEAYSYFVQSCPGIASLRLPAVWKPFNMVLPEGTSGDGPGGDVGAAKTVNRSITCLHAEKDLEQPEEVFKCIKALFPNLRNIYGTPGGAGPWRELLSLVETWVESRAKLGLGAERRSL